MQALSSRGSDAKGLLYEAVDFEATSGIFILGRYDSPSRLPLQFSIDQEPAMDVA